jgi:hypothetical protein
VRVGHGDSYRDRLSQNGPLPDGAEAGHERASKGTRLPDGAASDGWIAVSQGGRLVIALSPGHGARHREQR